VVSRLDFDDLTEKATLAEVAAAVAKREAAIRRGNFTNDDSDEETEADGRAAKPRKSKGQADGTDGDNGDDDDDDDENVKLHPWHMLIQRVT